EEGEELVLGDVERDVVECGAAVAAAGAVRLVDALEADQGPAGWAATALFLRRQEIVGVDLLERHLPLEAEILRVRVTRLLEPRRLELADRDRPFHDFLGVGEAAGHTGGAPRRARSGSTSGWCFTTYLTPSSKFFWRNA